MSSSRPSQSSSASNRSKHSARIIAQTTVDAKLDAEFEAMGNCFDYSQSIRAPPNEGKSEKVTAYLQHIQIGKLIQPFGCLLALDEKTFKIIAFSENAPDMLTTTNHAVPSVGDHPSLDVGSDTRTIFTSPSTAALHKAMGFAEVSLLNPILVHCKASGRPFYAIMHRVTGCLVIDLEPVNPSEVPVAAAGALQSYKLAAKAIAKLHSLPDGSMKKLCNTVVEEVFELTGYDRVMLYKFHEDDHGEVYAEITKPGLEPYVGLHYPATDIPQAARFFFMKNKVRMICDCRAKHLKIHQDENLPFNISFCGSTLRAPHSCHLQYMENMNSIASLVMAVIVNDGDGEDCGIDQIGQNQQMRKRLWGLVVCHNESPRFVPFPLRYACEFLMQVFAIHVNKEFELEKQRKEKNSLRTQALLCDMLLRDFDPPGIITRTPNIMDLIQCDGAAFLYQNKIWRIGVTPNESQIQDIAFWLDECHMDSTGLSTDSLHEAGYPGAVSLDAMVCGMAAARITSKDAIFWFRSPAATDIRWGGAKHDPADEDDGRRMHPRSSFKAFLEVARTKSLPWSNHDMDAVYSLQLILRGTFHGTENKMKKVAAIDSQMNELKLDQMLELQVVTSEMVRLIETASVPILAVDADGIVNGWNMKIAELTSLSVSEALGKHVLALVEDSSVDAMKNILLLALQGKEERNVEFQLKTFGLRRDDGPIILIVNVCASRDFDGNVVGVCFVAQDVTDHKSIMAKFIRIEGDYKAIVQNPNPLIPPIFGVDEFGSCSEWNLAMLNLSGWRRDEVIDKMLLGEVFGVNTGCCRMNQDSFVDLCIIINNAMIGQKKEESSFSFINRSGKHVECLLSASKNTNSEGNITGVFCFLQAASHEIQQVIQDQRLTQQTTMKRLKALTYIRNEIRNPLSGIMYSWKMLQGTDLSEDRMRILSTGTKCLYQLNRILDDLDLENIMDSRSELEMKEFTLKDVVVTAISQVMLPSTGKGVRLSYDLPDNLKNESIFGDSLRLQQIFADFLLVCVKHSPYGGQVDLSAELMKDKLGESLQLANLEVRIKHEGNAMPEELLSQMFGSRDEPQEDGLSLLFCRKLLKLMNGDARYLREADSSAFILSAELACDSKPKVEKS